MNQLLSTKCVFPDQVEKTRSSFCLLKISTGRLDNIIFQEIPQIKQSAQNQKYVHHSILYYYINNHY